MVDSAAAKRSKLSPATDSTELRQFWKEFTVVWSESSEACSGFVASWIKRETSSLSEVLCFVNSAYS